MLLLFWWNFVINMFFKKKVTKPDVIQAYRELLGRDPESETVIQAYLACKTQSHVRLIITQSQEYKQRMSASTDRMNAAGDPRQKPKFIEGGKTSPNFWKWAGSMWGGKKNSVQPQIAFVGNCQVNMIASLCNAMQREVNATGWEMTPRFFKKLRRVRFDDEMWAGVHCIWVHPNKQWQDWLLQQPADFQAKVRPLPTIDTLGFHPDCAYVYVQGKAVDSPIGAYHSVLVLWGFLQGMSVQATRALFNAQVFRYLGFFDLHAAGVNHLVNKGRQCSMPVHQWLAAWQDAGVWMHTINHPKPLVLADVALHCIAGLGIEGVSDACDVVDDTLARAPCWPVYPEVAQALGLRTTGNYAFKGWHRPADQGKSVHYMGLDSFIQASFALYARYAAGDLQCDRLQAQAFKSLPDFLAQRAAQTVADGDAVAPGNPYLNLPDAQFWRRSVERVSASALDPVLAAPFRISPTDKVATAGSCFAQHIARTLVAHGFHYLVTERADDLSPETQLARNYGVFSARFGNVYTARQLLQLLEMALGVAPSPQGLVWPRVDGRWVDGLRPYIEPEGFDDEAQALASRQQMLACTSDMFQGCDVLVFTLGLTEAWHRPADGVVLPLAPGVASAAAPMGEFAFVNFSHDQVLADMRVFLWLLKSVNAKVRVVLTVSPVPLVATYEPRSVMASTAYSKAVLRSVAGELEREFDWVAYFASYEVITAAPNAGRYFGPDWREVLPEGVAHVMGLFMKHFALGGDAGQEAEQAPASASLRADLDQATQSVSAVICDEQKLDSGPLQLDTT